MLSVVLCLSGSYRSRNGSREGKVWHGMDQDGTGWMTPHPDSAFPSSRHTRFARHPFLLGSTKLSPLEPDRQSEPTTLFIAALLCVAIHLGVGEEGKGGWGCMLLVFLLCPCCLVRAVFGAANVHPTFTTPHHGRP